MKTLAATIAFAAAALHPGSAFAQDVPVEPAPADTQLPETQTTRTEADDAAKTSDPGPLPTTTQTAPPKDPNTVIGGTTTFPPQNPFPGAGQPGPLSDWSGPYVEAGLGFLAPGGGSGATARIGYHTSKLVGVEAEYTTGLADLNVNFFQQAKLESTLAGFVVGRIPIEDRVALFGRIGYHQSDISLTQLVFVRDENMQIVRDGFGLPIPTGETTERDIDLKGLATGLGGEVYLSENLGFRLDFTRFETSDIDITRLSAGVQLRF